VVQSFEDPPGQAGRTRVRARRLTGPHNQSEDRHPGEWGVDRGRITARQRETLDHVRGIEVARIPEGMKWCPHCSGYGSSLKGAAGRCTRCGGCGLVGADRERPVAGRDGEPSDRR
jgi:hypothetical protein